MSSKLKTRLIFTVFIVSSLIAGFAIVGILNNLPIVNAEQGLTITGYTGNQKTFALADMQNLPSVTMYGGFYQPTRNIINNGYYTGVSLLVLCNQVGGIRPTSTIVVTGQNGHIFRYNYNMVTNGMGFYPTYQTYNNLTGALKPPTLPITIILAYLVNGTNLPTHWSPPPRLIIVGPEGLLFDGEGGRSITQITITDSAPSSTSIPSPSATFRSPTPSTSLSASPIQSLTPGPTPSSTQIQSQPPSRSPSLTPSPSPSIPEFSLWSIIALFTIVAVAVIFFARNCQQKYDG